MRSRPPISFSDLSGARVGVWGLGIEGTANLQRLTSLTTDLVVVEDAPAEGRMLGHDVLGLGEGGLEALRSCSVVVKTPGVRRRRPEVAELEAAGIPVVGGLGLWMQEAPLERVLLVTGTKGKSTTTAVAGHLLTRLGYRTLVGGNIGRAPYDPLQDPEFDYAIIEVSSFQATDLATSAPVVAVTSLHPDHLDWHGGVEEYFGDKLSACAQPGADLTVADATSPLLAERADHLGPHLWWVRGDEPDLGGRWLSALGLRGDHNRRNAMIARACLVSLGVTEASDADALAYAAEEFAGLDSRLREIGSIAGVKFVDDSLSTNVLPTVAALDAYPHERIALIVGGHDRGIDYGPLGQALAARAARPGSGEAAVFSIPENGARISETIREHLGGSADVTDCGDLREAVKAGYAWASGERGVVLLSPAAPSFGLFRDYKDRALAFAAAMSECER